MQYDLMHGGAGGERDGDDEELMAMKADSSFKDHTFDAEKAKEDPFAKHFGKRTSNQIEAGNMERELAKEEEYRRENAERLKAEERAAKIALLKEVIADGSADVGNPRDYMYKQGIQDILEKLEHDLVGLAPVKDRVKEIAALLVADKMRLKLGLETSVPSLHMCFTGSPGTGKTTVALRMGQIYQRMGYSRKGHVVVATRDDLVGQYVGHTAPKTKEVIKRAMGGILLVDEAYYLFNAENDRDYGQESIEILLNVMEQNKEDIVVVLAGYEDKMDRFFSFIPGMKSRIGNVIDFPNYGADELVGIGKVMCREQGYSIDDAALDRLRDYMELRQKMPFFANARTVRNAIDDARMKQAMRIFNEKISDSSDGEITEEELLSLKAADIPTEEELMNDPGATEAEDVGPMAKKAPGRKDAFGKDIPPASGGSASFEDYEKAERAKAGGGDSFEDYMKRNSR
jgi:probable Rubsico expression protein CbbX